MAQYWDLEKLTEEWEARGYSRRELMRLIAGGAGMSVMLALLGRSQSVSAQSASPAAGEGTAAPAAQGGTVNMLWGKPVSLSPIYSTSGSEQQVERLMFGALVKMSDKLVPTPDLAEKIDVNDDASVYTFHLHKNATFSDGTPLTARDVVFTFERAIDKRTGSIWRGRLLNIKGAEEYGDQKAESVAGLVTPDDHTVEITLIEPDAAFLVILGSYSGLGIIPEHILKDADPEHLQEHPFTMAPTVSAGAFKYVQYAEDQYLEIERNETYWGDPPPLDKIFLQILTPDVGQAKLETGEINLMTLPVSEIERTKQLEGVIVTSVPSPSVSFLAINLLRPYLQSKELRQAITYAIDREGILKQIFQGEGEVVNSPIIGPEWMGIPEGLNPYEYNPDKAKELLGKSGYDKNQKLEFMFVPGQSKENDAVVAIIQEQLKQVGFNVELLQVDNAEYRRSHTQASDFDMYLGGGGVFRADPSVSGSYFQTKMFSPGGSNSSRYSNPEVDKLYVQGQAVKDLEERKKIYTQIAQILNDELPWIFLWSPNSIYALTDNLHGFAPPSYIDNKMWNAETWSVTPEK